MYRLLVGFAPAIVVLVHAMAPPSAEAHLFGRCGGYYSPRYYSSYGYGCYRPSYYNYGNYGYSNGYSNYGGSYGYSPYGYSPYGVGGGVGFGGGSALTTLLAAGGLGGSNASMYLTVPMANGYGPASLLQVPLGGAAGRPTYLQVPMGGGPGQPVYLQMELGTGSAPVSPAPQAVPRPMSMSLSGYDRVTMDDVPDAAAVPYAVTVDPSVQSLASTSTATSNDPPNVESAPMSNRLFRFAVLERPAATEGETTGTPAKTAGWVSNVSTQSVSDAPLERAPNVGVSIERLLPHDAEPWEVR